MCRWHTCIIVPKDGTLANKIEKNRILILKARPIDIIRLISFYRNLEKDIETRKFYRFLPFYSLSSMLKSVFYLLSTLLIPFIYRRRLFFLALKDREIIGVCHIEKIINNMIGEYGIVINRKYRRFGLSKILSLHVLKYAINVEGLKMILLFVDQDNGIAMNLYRKLGFKVIKYIKDCDYRYVDGKKVGCYAAIYKYG